MTEDLTQAARDVIAERRRQQTGEGYTLEHDDGHNSSELVAAACVYALEAVFDGVKVKGHWRWRFWPWPMEQFNPKDKRHDLVAAAALIIAEIERLDRCVAGRR